MMSQIDAAKALSPVVSVQCHLFPLKMEEENKGGDALVEVGSRAPRSSVMPRSARCCRQQYFSARCPSVSALQVYILVFNDCRNHTTKPTACKVKLAEKPISCRCSPRAAGENGIDSLGGLEPGADSASGSLGYWFTLRSFWLIDFREEYFCKKQNQRDSIQKQTFFCRNVTTCHPLRGDVHLHEIRFIKARSEFLKPSSQQASAKLCSPCW